MAVNLKPLGDRILVEPAEEKETKKGGIIIPDSAKEKPMESIVVALGTGQALDMGRRGDADVVFVHAKPLEEKFVADGFGIARRAVMYNDFVLVGPSPDSAGIAVQHF